MVGICSATSNFVAVYQLTNYRTLVVHKLIFRALTRHIEKTFFHLVAKKHPAHVPVGWMHLSTVLTLEHRIHFYMNVSILLDKGLVPLFLINYSPVPC